MRPYLCKNHKMKKVRLCVFKIRFRPRTKETERCFGFPNGHLQRIALV